MSPVSEWLLRQLNITDEFVHHVDEVHLAFQHPLLLVLGLVLLVPISVFIYFRQKWNLPSVPPLLRFTLTATRVLILLLLVIVLGGPYLSLDHDSEQKPIVALLFDHSQSMHLPAGPFDSEGELTRIATAAGYRSNGVTTDSETRLALNRIRRAKLAQTVVQNSQPLLERLGKSFELRYYSFSRQATQLGVDPIHPQLPEPPNPGGPTTQAGDAIAGVLDDAAGRQVAGLVVFSDGQNTGGRSPIEAAQPSGGTAAPIFAVPVGSTQLAKDVAIVDLFTSALVSRGDTAKVAVTLQSNGFDGRPVKIELKDGEQMLDSKEVLLDSKEQQQVELTFVAKEPGARYLKVQVTPQAEEIEDLRGNNTDTAFLRVSDEKIKVLFVEGLPRWDFRFLKNAMRRDHGLGGRTGDSIDLCLEAEWRRQLPPQRAKLLPRSLDQLAEYHVIILGDASPRMIDDGFLEALDQAVRERGVGLIVAAGPLSMPHRYGERLHELLPVRLREGRAGQYPRGIPSFRIELTPEGGLHDGLRFYDEPGHNQNAWTGLAPYFWCAAAERKAPGATVLAWNPIQGRYGKVPLIAEHYAGKGKVMFVGTDSTWLWRRNVGDRFFYKFWGQSLRAVARHEGRGGKKSWIEVRPLRAQPGEQAGVELMAFASDGSPSTEPKLEVQVQGGSSATTIEMTPDPSLKGRYLGKLTPETSGEYRLVYQTGDQNEPVEAQLHVSVAPEELRFPQVNRTAMEKWAGETGGQLIELPDLANLEERLQGKAVLSHFHRETSVWDNGLTLALLILLYSFDVGLRRLVGLS